jgi:hypothetical protein
MPLWVSLIGTDCIRNVVFVMSDMPDSIGGAQFIALINFRLQRFDFGRHLLLLRDDTFSASTASGLLEDY